MFDLTRFDLALFEESAGHAAALLRLLGNEKRLMVLCQLADEELSVGELQRRVEGAVAEVIAAGRDVTYDLRPDRDPRKAAGTTGMTEASIAALGS